jgi:hypothetical protein
MTAVRAKYVFFGVWERARFYGTFLKLRVGMSTVRYANVDRYDYIT